MFVYVLSKKGKPLMPCKPSVARLLFKEGKAKVKSRMPFIIKSMEAITEFKQPIVGVMGTGSKFIGCTDIANGEVLYQSEVENFNFY
jgi:hypothetical protein